MIRTYFNRSAGIWDEMSLEKDTTKLERMTKYLNIEPGSKVLDVGTGTGVLIPFLFGESRQIVALDFAEEMLRKAQVKGFKGNVDYLHADVTNIPLRDNIFDVTVCYASFPHFQDKSRALTEINRVTKSGGKLLICHTSNRARINEIHCQVPALANDLIPDEGEMQEMLSMAGFIDIKIEDNSESYLASARKPEEGWLKEV